MAGKHLKALFSAFRSGDELSFRRAAQEIIDEEEAKQHLALARDLRKLLVGGDEVQLGEAVTMPAPPMDREGEFPLATVHHPRRYFADLVLADPPVGRLQELAAEVSQPAALELYGIPRRRRVLFYGPPGCGKTTSAEALAAEIGMPIVVIRLDAVISSFLGETASNLRRLLDYSDTGSWVMLFDEFDALGRARDDATEHGEIKRVVNAFLQMLDGYAGKSLLVASTNHEGLLDPALWRRFDDVFEFPLPTVHQLRRVLRQRLKVMPSAGVDIEQAASALRGLPHAAAEATAWEACRHAILAGRSEVQSEDIESAVRVTRSRPW
jgi:SpoVK/Ycf46/Vps4 family AAA+-type ATPase